MSKDNEFLAYTAGFFDADGCVGIYRKDSPRNLYLRTTISQKLWMTIFDEWQDRWGGGTYHYSSGMWRWKLTSSEAVIFLRDILPYLYKKRPQARVAITFQERRDCLTGQQRGQYADALKELKRQVNDPPPELPDSDADQLKLF